MDKIVTAHGGSILVRSSAEVDTEFVMRLPRSASALAPDGEGGMSTAAEGRDAAFDAPSVISVRRERFRDWLESSYRDTASLPA